MNLEKYNDFIDYVLDVYPMQDLTRKDVELATLMRMDKCSLNGITFVGDSFDREAVRDILIDEFMFELWEWM